MDEINNSGKWIIGGIAVIVVIIVLVLLVGRHQNQNAVLAPNNTSTSQNNSATTTPGTTPTGSSPTPISKTTPPATPAPVVNPTPPPIVIHLITPVTNDQWVIGQQNPISWDNQPNITGQIDLLNASDKSLVGVITSETEPHQLSYSWNTRSYNLGRYGGLQKNVIPGTYLIEVKFDGNNLPNLIGGPITITN